MVAKQSWRVVTSDQSLSIHVLQSKYVKGVQGTSTLLARKIASPLWKGIVAQADLIKKGLAKLL